MKKKASNHYSVLEFKTRTVRSQLIYFVNSFWFPDRFEKASFHWIFIGADSLHNLEKKKSCWSFGKWKQRRHQAGGELIEIGEVDAQVRQSVKALVRRISHVPQFNAVILQKMVDYEAY